MLHVTASHLNEPNSARNARCPLLDGLIDASKRDLPAVLARGDVEKRGVVGWMMALGKLCVNPTRFAILLRLEEQDASMAELVELVGVNQSNVSRHLTVLRKAQVVAERAVGFDRGPRKVSCLTLLGQQFLEGLRQVAQQLVQTQFRDAAGSQSGARSKARAGRVRLNRAIFVELLDEVERFHQWRMLFGLESESQFRAQQRRVYKIASDAGVDLEWARQMENERGARGT